MPTGRPGDASGVALFVWRQLLGKARIPKARDSQAGSLGPEWSVDEIQSLPDTVDPGYERIDDEQRLVDEVAEETRQGRW